MKKYKMKKIEKEKLKKLKVTFTIFIFFILIFSVVYTNCVLAQTSQIPKTKAQEKMEKFQKTMEIVGTALQVASYAQYGWGYFALGKKLYELFKDLKKRSALWLQIGEKHWINALAFSSMSVVVIGVITLVLASSTTRSSLLLVGIGEAKQETRMLGTKYCSLCSWDPFTTCTPQRCYILGNCYFEPSEDGRGGVCMPAMCEEGIPQITKMNAVFEFQTEHQIEQPIQINADKCPNNEGKGCSIITSELSYNVSRVNISFSTNMPAQCKYIIDKKQASFEEMTLIDNLVADEIEMPKEHVFSIDISKLQRGAEHYLFIKCKGPCGGAESTHPASYDWNFIKFEIESWPDWVAPSFVVDPSAQNMMPAQIEMPMNVIAVSDEKKYFEARLYLDKEGVCGYSTTHPKLNLTTNFFLDKGCREDMEIGEAMCHFNTKLEGDYVINSNCELDDECKYYLLTGETFVKKQCTKCVINISLTERGEEINWDDTDKKLRDAIQQIRESPPEDTSISIETTENVEGISQSMNINLVEMFNQFESQNIKLAEIFGKSNRMFRLNFVCANEAGYKSESQSYNVIVMPSYNITIESPKENEEIAERNVKLIFNTTKPAACSYSIDIDMPFSVEDRRTEMGFAIEHDTTIENLSKGEHTIYIKCRDIFNIEESASVKFNIVKMPKPNIIRMYVSENKLFIETSIASFCGYNINSCNFNLSKTIEEGKSIESVEEMVEGTGEKAEETGEGTGGGTEVKEVETAEETAEEKTISWLYSSRDNFLHTTYSNEAIVYYTKCIDIMQDNIDDVECIEIKPFTLPSLPNL